MGNGIGWLLIDSPSYYAMFLHNLSLTVTSWANVSWYLNCHYNEVCLCNECRYKKGWLYKVTINLPNISSPFKIKWLLCLQKTGEQVAIKEFSTRESRQAILAREREVELLRKFKHKNVIQLFDCEQEVIHFWQNKISTISPLSFWCRLFHLWICISPLL